MMINGNKKGIGTSQAMHNFDEYMLSTISAYGQEEIPLASLWN